jgi:hypothetical protein
MDGAQFATLEGLKMFEWFFGTIRPPGHHTEGYMKEFGTIPGGSFFLAAALAARISFCVLESTALISFAAQVT